MFRHVLLCGHHTLQASRQRMLSLPGSLMQSAKSARPVSSQLTLFRQMTTDKVKSQLTNEHSKAVGWWMAGISGMTFGIVVVGGITRLTESGLSMTSWRLLGDMKYPDSVEAWTAEFERYQQFPEYKELNRGMTLEEFKNIYFWEWSHRMIGRAIGMAFIIPGAFFAAKGWIPPQLRKRVLFIGGLIGFQGFLGWYMVKSGLEENSDINSTPRVSQYRLASHLGTAFVIYLTSLWTSFNLLLKHPMVTDQSVLKLRGATHGVAGLAFLTAISGAFVAGLDAGLIYNTFPLMGGRWIPSDLLARSPTISNFFENPTTVQFDHRWLGTTTAVGVAGLFLMARKRPLPSQARLALNMCLGVTALQVTLGISTLLMSVPIHLAATHQAGSLTLMSMFLWLMHETRKSPLLKNAVRK